jgi:hypothetical protein
MRVVLLVLFLTCTSFYQKDGVQIYVFSKEDNLRIFGFKVYYKNHKSQKFQKLHLRNGFKYFPDDQIDILLVTKDKRILFEMIELKYLKESKRYFFYISNIDNRNIGCIFYHNLSVGVIGKNRLNEEDCSDLLRISGPLNDEI